MNVRQGWSGEQPGGAWRKIDVELDEADLARLIVDLGIPPEMTSVQVFALMSSVAEVYLLSSIYKVTGAQHHRTELSNAIAARDRLVSKLRNGE
jgi:hypothetical protein